MRKKRSEPEGSEKYREVNNNIKRCTKKAKENWIEKQCSDTEENLKENNSKRAYQLVKDLTTVKQGKVTTVKLTWRYESTNPSLRCLLPCIESGYQALRFLSHSRSWLAPVKSYHSSVTSFSPQSMESDTITADIQQAGQLSVRLKPRLHGVSTVTCTLVHSGKLVLVLCVDRLLFSLVHGSPPLTFL